MQYITSIENKIIKDAAKLLTSPSKRREQGLFIIEGARLCGDALKSGAKIKQVFFTEEALKKHQKLCYDIIEAAGESYTVSEQVINRLSDTKTSQGLVCTLYIPDNQVIIPEEQNSGKIIALENISDPVNLGTILRTAEALGLSGVVMSDNCCDLYSPKVLRGSMGAVFRVNAFITNDLPGYIYTAKNRGFKALASVVEPFAKSICKADLNGKVIIAVGNEANGLTQALIAQCGEKITVPMNGNAESLNAAAAAAIIMWEMIRQCP